MENIQQQYLPSMVFYPHPNVDFLFLYQLFCWIFMHIISLNLYCFLMHYHGKKYIVLPHSIEPRIPTWAIWNYIFLLWECKKIHEIHIELPREEQNIYFSLFFLSCLCLVCFHITRPCSYIWMFLILVLNRYVLKYMAFNFMRGSKK